MKTAIYSRESIENLIRTGFPKDTAAISFSDMPLIEDDPYCIPVSYPSGVDVFYSANDDIPYKAFYYNDPRTMGVKKLDEFFTDANKMAVFILEQAAKGIKTIICQCEHGQSRSAAAAAAIEQFFNKDGIEIFADYRYSPNQIIYNKLIKSLVTQNVLRRIDNLF